MVWLRARRRWYEVKAALGFNGWRHGSPQHWLHYLARGHWLPGHLRRQAPPWSDALGR